MNYTTQSGLLTELQCQQDFSKCGILLSQPIINDSRYDFLADIDGKIYKIQCKTCRTTDEQENAIVFAVSNRNWNHGAIKNYQGQVDFFYTSYNGQGYLVPIEDVGVKEKTLRFRSKNTVSENEKISWAENYQIETVLVENLNYSIPTYSKPKTRAINRCKICGTEISQGATYCVSCCPRRQKSEKPISRDELKCLIRLKPIQHIARDLGVSSATIRKWCADYGLPNKVKEINKYLDDAWEAV